MIFLILLAVLTCLVRCSHVACWFVSPLLTVMCFFYLSILEYEPENVSPKFAVVAAISVSYFITTIFNEVWLISTVVYLPLVAYYMATLGKDYVAVSKDNSELIMRTFFATIVYAIVSYMAENYSKRAFVGTLTEEVLFKRWLQIFESFPEGLAYMRDKKILYVNSSLTDLLDIKSKTSLADDPLYTNLKRDLKNASVTRTGDVEYNTTVWDFFSKVSDKGGPFKLN